MSSNARHWSQPCSFAPTRPSRLFPPPSEERTDPHSGEVLTCRLRDKGRQKVTVTTLCGDAVIWRKRWQYAEGGCETPLDEWLGIADDLVTQGVLALACLFNRGSTGFRHTAKCLSKAASIQIGKEKLRVRLIQVGQSMYKAIQRGQLQPEWTAADCQVEAAPLNAPIGNQPAQQTPDSQPKKVTRVYLGSDGVKVPLITQQEKQKRRQKTIEKRKRLRKEGQKLAPLPPMREGTDQSYKEFKIVTYYSQDHKHRVVSVTKEDCEAAGKIMKRDASRLKLAEADEAIGIFDGAPWIVNQTVKQSLPLCAKGLDFYHLKDNIQKTRREVFGDDPNGLKWADQLVETFKTNGFTSGFDELIHWRSTLTSQRAKQSADRLVGYISERRELIAYPEFRANGWDIGSGPTEAQCKTTTNRVKGHGRRWDASNAEAMCIIESVYQSDLQDQYWNLN